MKRGEQDGTQGTSAVGVWTLVRILQIIRRREVVTFVGGTGGTERRNQSTFMEREVER